MKEKILNTFVNNPYVIFVITLKDLWDISTNLLLNVNFVSSDTPVNYDSTQIDWIGFILKIIIAIILYLILKSYKEIKSRTELSISELNSTVNKLNDFIKSQDEYIEAHKIASIYRMCSQYQGSWKDYDGTIFKEVVEPQITSERSYVKKKLVEKYPDKTNNQIEDLLNSLYK